MSYAPIVPAIIPTSREEVIKFSQLLNFSKEIQLDLVDGKFVQAVCWPYEPIGEPLSVKSFLDGYTLEIDLMVEEPIKAANEWIVAGADMVVFHIETLPLEVFKNFVTGTDVSVGASAHGDTTLETLITYCEYADYIQLMGIKEVGAQGQPFDETVIDKIIALKKLFPYKSITIDGSVNKNTIEKLRKAGADRFIVGSAIVQQTNPEAAYKELGQLVI